MLHYLDALRARQTPAAEEAADAQVDCKRHDADGLQLAQTTGAAASELTDWKEIPRQPQLDLDVISTERRRAARARMTRKR